MVIYRILRKSRGKLFVVCVHLILDHNSHSVVGVLKNFMKVFRVVSSKKLYYYMNVPLKNNFKLEKMIVFNPKSLTLYLYVVTIFRKKKNHHLALAF